MSRINFKVSGKRAAQRLVGRYKGAQAFVYLSIFTLAPLLNRLHDEQANPNPDDRVHVQSQ